MFGLSIFEIIFLAGLALIVIGPKELPQVARTLGRFLNELKRSTSGFTEELKQQARIDRIDLYEAPKKAPTQNPNNPHSNTEPVAEKNTSDVDPAQMELTEQKPSSSENKNS
ncbi:twin-arginine translocase TatA/TatE family subunit [Bdellovibrio sp. NC01]|uniref:Sec-independent protein translocase subunit TatA/TatB n=1 Tax=Bdellovibrio sp. NC01 TaxID=2220073 RepID=UPI0011587F0C|nr:twin-arginine translocase TatA/TatE family subunit [Bdellovibrio sp. NC01]QDK39529.1 preprotein translocase [Bdellovibrio sp. NC01]